MPALKNMKRESFCVAYTTIGAESYGNAINSAIDAGYEEKSARTTGWRLLQNEAVQKRICGLHTKNMQRNLITVDKVLADLEHDKLMARKHHQYNVAKGCDELQGKFLAMFTDRLDVNPEREAAQRAMLASEAEKLRLNEQAKERTAQEATEPGKQTIPFRKPVEEPQVG